MIKSTLEFKYDFPPPAKRCGKPLCPGVSPSRLGNLFKMALWQLKISGKGFDLTNRTVNLRIRISFPPVKYGKPLAQACPPHVWAISLDNNFLLKKTGTGLDLTIGTVKLRIRLCFPFSGLGEGKTKFWVQACLPHLGPAFRCDFGH